MQHALEVEKMKKKELQEQLHKTKSALQAARNEGEFMALVIPAIENKARYFQRWK